MESSEAPVVLMLGLPEGALGGIDLLSFTTTPRFRGVKGISTGLHFAFASPTTAFSERHGIWFDITNNGNPPDVIVTQWDAASEALVRITDETEILRQRANLGSIWNGLTPYRQEVAKTEGDDVEVSSDWSTLTASITPTLLSRLLGNGADWKVSSANSSRRDLEDIPGLVDQDLDLQPGEELHFLPIDLKQTWREGATGRERTDAAQDRSWALNNLTHNPLEIIGELQFCFLMILTINNFSCLEQWKRLLTLLFTCKSAVAEQPDLFIAAIAALRIQLQHCKDAEGGLIDLADEGGSLLKSLLVRFRKGLTGLDAIDVQDVVDELDDLEEYLKQEYGWQFGGSFAKTGLLELEDGEQVRMDTTAFDEDDETGEFAPQVVDLTPEQAKLLGVQDEVDLPQTLTRTSDESEDNQDLEDMDSRY
ncbi:AAR2 protein-domain-containing protein [Neohortaea acidophila]|uniref:AAR2 protein-domain-containing protein n=1 Tax=Neohortaea acidophila TaxID=245834 RepID=A0A6A6Q685_9PEZI|nr:AAR2 protein-domain-containing protein [Neohortaea acidophila]KAF2487948.1 AAR2 protein-domain-containing protein [Neohortaea acidophila]